MNLPEILLHPLVSPLARQFARFCAEQDPAAPGECLVAAAWLAECDLAGDTCLELARYAGKPLWHDEDGGAACTAPALDAWLERLRGSFLGRPGERRPLILDGQRLYLHRHWRDEGLICTALQARMKPAGTDPDWLRERLDALFAPVAPGQTWWWQKCAVAMALTRRLALITGGPGTGKTTTVTRILALLLEQAPGLRVQLAAPTGKAAARLAESIARQKRAGVPGAGAEAVARLPERALTLHRLLGWQPDGFRHDADNPLPCDCLIVDECSMVDQGMMARLLEALPRDARLILLGDRNQLASVEAGSVFGDLTGQGRTLNLSGARAAELENVLGPLPPGLSGEGLPPVADHLIELRHSFRFAAGGGIGRLAARVNAADAAGALDLVRGGDDELDHLPVGAGQQVPHRVLEWMREHYLPALEAPDIAAAMDRFEASRVLCALREGPWGEQALAEQFRLMLMREDRLSGQPGPAHGVPLLILRNDYETGLFNGDTGMFWETEGELLAWFRRDGELVSFVPAQLPAWQPAWTLTVHRSQGSEYDRVLLLLPPRDSPVLCRELIYTGITRARRHCTLVCDPTLLGPWIGRNSQRQSGLAGRLGWERA